MLVRALKTTAQFVCWVLSMSKLANCGIETLGSFVQAIRSRNVFVFVEVSCIIDIKKE